jgi:hypothetical protein
MLYNNRYVFWETINETIPIEEGVMPKNIIISILLLITAGFAMNNEVITYTNNWGQAPMFNVVSKTDAGIEVVFSIHQMTVEENEIDGTPMKSYGIPGIFLANEEGAPNLAGTGRYIAIPQGATARATIVDFRTETYQNVEVAPAPNIPLDNDDSPLQHIKNMDIYAKDAYYPDNPVKLSDPLHLRGVDCVILGIMPFQYNPVTKELIVYKDLRVRVDFYGGNGHFGDDALRSIYWEPLLQGNLLNYSSLPKIDFFSPERINSRDGYEYIIIVPDDPAFIALGDTIKKWRKLQGISTEVYTLTQVGGSTSTAIENFLNNAYNTWNPRPVGFLLLSDYPSSGDLYGITSPVWNSYCVSDLIYADVNGDHIPEMFHGRITAQNESQLSVMVKKFLNYERTPPTNPTFYDAPIVCAAWQTERWFQLCGEVVRGFMDTIHGLNKNPTRLYAIYSGTPTVGGTWSTTTYGNTSAVVNYFYNLGWLSSTTNQNGSAWWNNGNNTLITQAINNGAFLLQHRDHGGETGWGEPAYSNSDISNLTNDDLIFVNSHNCLTGKYDWSSECFTEKFHRWNVAGVPKGALGVSAASEVSYSFVNDCFVWGMYDCMWQHFMPDYPTSDVIPTSILNPCAAMNYGKIFLYGTTWLYSGIDPYRVHTYNLFHHHGDVFNTLYSEAPQNLTVTHMPTLMAGVSSFTVTANDSAIIALTVDGEIIGAAQATGSPLAITITPQIPGSNMIVTITKQNYYRYQATVPVVSSSYPYVVATSPVVNDSGANGQVNPGERIDYGFWAKNIGIGTAQGIHAKLTSADSFTTVVTDSSWFGTIAADDSVYSNPVYRFRTSRNTPNNHQINLTFTFKDINDSTFISYRSVRVYRPILTYQNVTVMGGNNNGIFNQGETVDVVVTLKNEGGANAENVTANLLVTNPHIGMLDSLGSFDTITPTQTATNTADPFTVFSDTLITPGTMVQFWVAVNHGFYTDTFEFSLPVEIYIEDFETTNGGYAPSPVTGAWEWGIPTSGPGSAHSGVKLWATVLGGNYANSIDWRLTTPELVAAGDTPQFKFWHWYSTENRYDGGNVKISTDDQVTWQLVHPVGGYPDTAYASNIAIPRESCYTSTTSGQVWSEAVFNLPVVTGQRFFIRWHFGTDASGQYPGWYVDDVTGIGLAPASPLPNDVGVKMIVEPGAHHFTNTQMQPRAWVKNYGLVAQNNIPVVCSIFGAGNVMRYYNTANVLSLAAGESTLVNFSPWTPNISETCLVCVQTYLTGDENLFNDRKTRLTNISTTIDIVIGTGTSTSSLYPMYCYYANSVTEAIYLQSEIDCYGYINNLAYYKNSGSGIFPIENVRIYMQQTTETSVATGAWDTTGYTLVFNGSFTNNGASGWMDIELDDPFLFDNSENLKILIIKGPPSVTSGYPSWRYTSTSPTYRNRYAYNNTSIPASLTQTYSRPNIKFTLSPSAPPMTDVGVHGIVYPSARHFVNTAMVPIARIKNYGVAAQTNFPVACTIFGATGEVRYSDVQTVASLIPGDTAHISFTSFTPTIIETCQVVFRTLLLNDSNPDNNRRARYTFITNSMEIVIGTGTSGSGIYCIYAYRTYTVSNAIYLQPEIGYYGYVTNLAYYKTSGSNTTQIDDVRIYMRLTDQSTVATGAYDTTGFTRVYSGPFPINAIGWMGVELNPAFLYNNQENIEILILKGPPAMTSGYPSWQYTTQSPNYRNRYQYSDAGWPTSLTQTYYRPNIRFYLTPTAPGVEELPFEFPLITQLNAAKPNPFSKGVTNISFVLASPANTALKIYDASGRLIKTLVNAQLEQGMHNYVWNGKDQNNRAVAEGVYFYTLQADNYRQTKKLILTR